MLSLWFRVTSFIFVDQWVGFGIKKVTKFRVWPVLFHRFSPLKPRMSVLPLHTNCALELLLGQWKVPKALLGPQAWLLVA